MSILVLNVLVPIITFAEIFTVIMLACTKFRTKYPINATPNAIGSTTLS